MMTAIPAMVAGVPNVCVACPKAVGEVFGTADLLGVRQVFQMGGAQAIAAFAFGTRTVPRADRIVGPGNIYVAAAKKLLAGEVGIDFIAGPTEILIIAGDGDPRHYAGDMLAQAEHDVDASAILLTSSKRLALAVATEVERQLASLPTRAVAAKAIAKNSAIILVRDAGGGAGDFQSLRARAFEHSRCVAAGRRAACRQRLRGTVQSGSGGRLRVGSESRAAHQRRGAAARRALGDGLSEGDFGAGIDRGGARANWRPSITTLARAEGLEAHARSVEVRL